MVMFTKLHKDFVLCLEFCFAYKIAQGFLQGFRCTLLFVLSGDFLWELIFAHIKTKFLFE